MILKRLSVTNLRAFHRAEFEFREGMNLLVGINGVGKSTVLDAIRILLSQFIKRITHANIKALQFKADDLTIGRNFLDVEVQCDTGNLLHTYLQHAEFALVTSKLKQGFWQLKTKGQATTDDGTKSRLLSVYFSPQRSIFNLYAARKGHTHGEAAPYAEALFPRSLRVQEFADWWLSREVLIQEGLSQEQQKLDALNDAACRFLDGCTQLRAIKEPKKTLQIEKAGMWLDVKQMSDGERGLLAMVLDLTRRLAWANPNLEDPARHGQAIVLIDELDLHLHPKWQRRIVHQLTETFPKCQFIATTHSPQIVSEVQPDGLTLLFRDNDQVTIRSGTQAYGLDSNWILEHLMDVRSRPEPTQKIIDRIEETLEDGQLDEARKYLGNLRRMLHGDDGEVVRLEASINNLEALADEVDSEDE